MSNEIIKDDEYKQFINQIKTQIQSSQIKAAISVNQELLKLYWKLASLIVEKQENYAWGDGLIKQVSQDLQQEFPNMKGFSERNIKYMRQWTLFWTSNKGFGQQAVAHLEIEQIFQIPWGHHIVIMSKIKKIDEALFYVQQTIQNNWSRAVLVHKIESGLFIRQGQSISNFKTQLPKVQSDLAIQTLKDPYCFDFLTLRKCHDEKELENALTENITQFLLELGAGFSYIGKQFKLTINDDDFYIDLLFYHVKLHCYVVIELKTGKFKPEYAGKLNFYITAVDEMLADDLDKPTIGILICKSKNNTVVEYALKDIKKPIGVSKYELTKQIPERFKSSLPSIEEIEAELGGTDE
jgi:predicted nuclease of restriction endonuclease-like (RecB) superfamily